jgi:hypothetical protein
MRLENKIAIVAGGAQELEVQAAIAMAGKEQGSSLPI